MKYMTEGAACILVVGLLHFLLGQKKRRSPPGPWGLPFFGNILSLESQLHLSFGKWGQKYGPIVSVRFGNVRAVILHDIRIIREALNHGLFSGRPDLPLFTFYSGGKHGILNAEGAEWLEQRRFTLRHLRDFGLGRAASTELLIMEEVGEVLDWMGQNEGQSISLNRKFSLAVVNALMRMTTGKRYSHEDPRVKTFLDMSSAAFTEASQSGFMWFMPQLSYHIPLLFTWGKVTRAGKAFRDFFGGAVQEHEHSPNKDATDFTHAYLQRIRDEGDPSSSFFGDRGRTTLITVLCDLFDAGSATTTATLAWTFLYILTHPKVQVKLHQELDSVTGTTRPPCLADRPRTPYAECVIDETLRYSSIVPFSAFHSTTEEVTFGGYVIPKNTLVIPNLYAAHHDPKTWTDPHLFRPQRFLGPDGRRLERSASLVPFSVGKRQCIGEVMARDQIYLFLTNILHLFEARPDPDHPLPSLSPAGSFILQAQPYSAIFRRRSHISR